MCRKSTSLILIFLSSFITLFGKKLELLNSSHFTCEIQPVSNSSERTTMGKFAYTLRPKQMTTHAFYLQSITHIRWKVLVYSQNNKILSRNYFLAELPQKITPLTNINQTGAFVIMPDMSFRYYSDKNDLSRYIEAQPQAIKYIYRYEDSLKKWVPVTGIVNGQSFNFTQEMSNDIYR